MFLAQIKQAKATKKKKKQRKLHLSAAQQLVASQEADGHFDAFKLSFKMARVWEKLGIPSTSMPSGINTKNEIRNEVSVNCITTICLSCIFQFV